MINGPFGKNEIAMQPHSSAKNTVLFPAGLIVLASALVAGTTVLAKLLGQGHLGPELHPFQISFGRFAFAFLALILTAGIMRPKFENPNLKMHIKRTTAGWAGVTLMFAAVALIPLPDATAISFLSPVFAMILAVRFLGEKVGKYRWLAAIIALSGAFVLLRPNIANFQPAALLALGAAAFFGAELIMMKLLTRTEKPLQILIINNAIGLVLSGTIAFFVWQSPNMLQWAALIGIGTIMVMAQACYLNALRTSDASFIAPFSYATLIFAALYDFIFFGQVPDLISIIGGLTICAGAILLAIREHKAAKV